MKETILGVIDEELDSIDDSVDFEVFDSINNLVNEQNNDIKMDKYKLELIRILNEAKDMNLPIEFNENMSVEELESILNSIKI